MQTSRDVPAHWKVGVGLPPDYFFYMSPARFWAATAQTLGGVWRAARRADLVHAIKDYPHNWLGLTAARLSQWREQFLAGGEANLKARESDPQSQENQRLQAKIGELWMENELLYTKVHALEDGRPLTRRRPKR